MGEGRTKSTAPFPNAFLPKSLQREGGPAAHGDVEAVVKAIYAAGVDGLFSDFPGLAVKARG